LIEITVPDAPEDAAPDVELLDVDVLDTGSSELQPAAMRKRDEDATATAAARRKISFEVTRKIRSDTRLRITRMFNVGASELLVILLVALIVLGPEKLPETARKMGNIVAELRRMASGFR
jgi:hypothetical protein